MNADLLEEMKAKVEGKCGMTLTADEVKEVLAAVTPAVDAVAVESDDTVDDTEVGTIALSDNVVFVPVETEPAVEVKPAQGPLPDDFPGRTALAGAGVNTFAQARKARDSKEGLMGITGVGHATAVLIEEALG